MPLCGTLFIPEWYSTNGCSGGLDEVESSLHAPRDESVTRSVTSTLRPLPTVSDVQSPPFRISPLFDRLFPTSIACGGA